MHKKNWGGKWTEEKLKAFEKYVRAYLKIMHSQRKKHKKREKDKKRKENNWPSKIIYFDGFAGRGKYDKSEKRIKSDPSLFPNFTSTPEEAKVYEGSPKRVLKLEPGFDIYYFVDVVKENIKQLEEDVKEKFPEKFENCKFIHGDVNEVLKDFTQEMKKNKSSVALVMLDPFGMEISWKSIEYLKDLRVDIWILVPTGMAVNRLLYKNEELKNFQILEEFFGIKKEEIESYFYKTKSEETLFGEQKKKIKVENPINKIAQLYVERLKTIWKYVSEKPLELKNSKNVVIYHFIFASNNQIALKIADYIIGKKIERRKR